MEFIIGSSIDDYSRIYHCSHPWNCDHAETCVQRVARRTYCQMLEILKVFHNDFFCFTKILIINDIESVNLLASIDLLNLGPG